MKRGAQVLRRLSLFFLIANILLPFSMDAALAQDPTGSVTVVLYDNSTGGTVGGGTFQLDTRNGPITIRDGDDGASDGYATANGVPVGNVTARQTGGPDSHYLAASGASGAVPAGGTVTLKLYADPVPPPPPPDADGDGIPDSQDQYPYGDPDTDGDGIADFNDATPNGDNDGDGIDNLSDPYPNGDPDADADGVADGADNCVNVANPDQADNDGDLQGNACETDDPTVIDTDGDGVVDASDNCPAAANADQLDTDADGTGDACDATPNGDVTPTPDPATNDADSDGLTDATEAELGTNPQLADSDADGLTDGSEVNEHKTDPLTADTDGDGVSDADEIANGTNPNDPKDPAPAPVDADEDGVADDADNCVDVANKDQVDTDADGQGDACDTDDDNDGLSDDDEAKAGTDPLNSDTDGDGLIDADEAKLGTDPLNSDTDGDGLTDADEVNTHTTDPLVADTDTDGVNDGDEIAAGTDPLVAEAAALTLTKTATQLNGAVVEGGVTTAAVDEVITYEIVATNSGTAALSEVTVTDELVGKGLTCDPAAPAALEPGATLTCTATYTVTDTDVETGQVVNTATATASDANGDPVAVAPATVTVTVGEAQLRTANIGIQSSTVTDVNVDFTGVHPDVYNHTSPGATGGSYPADERETLNQGSFNCGEYVHYWNIITIVDGSGSFEFTNGFARQTSNGQAVGYDSIGAVFIDTANSTGYDDETVSFTQSVTASEVVANITLDNVEEGDVIAVRVSARLYCDVSQAGGVVQGRYTSSFGGDQTVNLTVSIIVLTPEVTITKTADAATVPAGSPIGFTITVTNSGNGEATGVGFTDQLPGGTGIVWSESPDQAACSIDGGGLLTCSGITLAADGGTFSVHVTSPTSETSANCGVYNNTATLSSPYSGQASASTEVLCEPNVTIAKTPDGQTVQAGEDLVFTITLTNSGNAPATGVGFTDTLPAVAGQTWTETPDVGACEITGGVLTCTGIDLPADGGTFSVTVSSPTSATSANCGTYNNTATLSEPYSGSDSGSITVECAPNVTIAKTADAESVDAGSPIGFTITVTNNGNAQATGVAFEDELPDVTGQTWSIESADANGTCAIDGDGTLTCSDITLDPDGGSFSVHVTSPTSETSANCGTYDNTATLTAGGTGNASASTEVLCEPNVTIAKTAANATVQPGDDVTFTVTLTNNGNAEATGVAFSDPLPGGLTWSWTENGGAPSLCSDNAGTLECSGITLAPDGGTFVVVLTATTATDSTNCGPIENTATLSAPWEGSATASTTVECSPSITIVKECPSADQLSGAGVGDSIIYTVTVTNDGNVDLTDVAVTDTRAGAFYSDAAATVASDFPTTLAAGASETRYFKSTITQGDADAGAVNNSATVSTAELDDVTSDKDCPFLPQTGFTVEKQCPDTSGLSVGDTIYYPIVITNTGDVAVSIAEPVDSVRPGGTFYDDASNASPTAFPLSIGPGSSETIYYSSTITADDAIAGNVDNSVTVTGSVTIGQATTTLEAVTDDTPLCPFTPDTGIEVTKSCPDTSNLGVGDDAIYEITVTNTGEVPVSITGLLDSRTEQTFYTDAAATLVLGTLPTLTPAGDPGDSVTLYYRSEILEADAIKGNIDNEVTVNGTATVAGEPIAVTDTADSGPCPFVPDTSIIVVKSCPTDEDPAVGDLVAYTLTIENTGEVPAIIDSIGESRAETTFYTDATLSSAQNFPFTVPTGDTVTLYYQSEILESDAIAGNIDNTATVNWSVEVGGQTQEQTAVEATATCDFVPETTFTVTKSCPDTTGLGVGDQVVYEIVIENTGEVPVTITGIDETRAEDVFYSDDTLNTVETFPLTIPTGDSVTLYYPSIITAQDAINGNIANSVTVNGTATVDGQTTPLDPVTADSGDCPFTPDTGIEVEKSCPTVTSETRVDSTIIYPITITNTGEVPVTISGDPTDSRPGGTFHSDAAGTLAPAYPIVLDPAGGDDDSVTLYYKSTVTAQDAIDGNVNNSVTVTGSVTIGNVTSAVSDSDDTPDCPFVPLKSIEITKSCPTIPAGARAGDPITYDVTITNTGEVPLTGIVVTESRTGNLSAPFPTELVVGASATRVFTSNITLDDAANGNVDNIATVSSTATVGGSPSIVTDTFNTAIDGQGCPFDPYEAIQITKTCPVIPEGAEFGDEITYEVTITNMGDVELTNIVVDEDRAGSFDSAWPASLAPAGQPGASATRTFTSTITLDDAANGNVDNHVSVTADATSGQTTVQVSDDFTGDCPFNPVEGIQITKTCPVVPEGARVGDAITYEVTITNTGDVELTNIVVVETRAGSFDSAWPASLAPDASATRTFTSEITLDDAANGNVDNSVTVTADAISGETTVQVTDDYVGECPFTPVVGVDIEKSCPTIPAGARVGDEITYEVTIRNTGDIELDITSVIDDRDGSFDSAWPATLAPEGEDGDTATRTFTSEITLADAAGGNVNNTVTVNTGQGVADTDQVDCPFTPVQGLEITKTCGVILDNARVGDAISYDVTISNTGDVTLTDVVVTDTRDGSFDSPFPTELAPGESATRTFTSEIMLADAANGNVDNSATVTANATVGTVLNGEPGIAGAAELSLNALVVSQLTDTADAACPFNPVESIEITKTCPVIPDGARVGEEITYDVTVTNTGDVTITELVLTDARDGSFDSAFPTELAPGDSATRTFTSEITFDDAAGRNVDNTVSVTGNATSGEQTVEVSDRYTAECPFDPVESIEIVKNCPGTLEGARVGDPIDYEVTITNTGDVLLTSVEVTDGRPGTFTVPFPTELAPGESATRTFRGEVLPSDAAAGNVNNTTTVTALAGEVLTEEASLQGARLYSAPSLMQVNGEVVVVTDTAEITCPFDPFEAVEIVKTCPVVPDGARVGDEITYEVTITNMGDVELTDVVVDEVREGSFDSDFPTTLAAGESATRTFTSTITLDDAANGNVDNSVTVTGNAISGETTTQVTDTYDGECPFNPVESIEIVKTCPVVPEGARVGDAITYEVTITNTGDVELTNIVVDEDRAGSFDSAWPASLAPDASATRTFTSTITLADAANGNVDNSVTVTADATSGETTVQVSDEFIGECPFEPVQGLEITKSCPVVPDETRVGETITYEVTITNTGDVTLTDVVVTDTREGAFTEPFPTELAAGESATRTFESTITLEDAANGTVDNSATVTANATVGTVLNGEPGIAGAAELSLNAIVVTELTATADANCPFEPFGHIVITKTCPVVPDGARVGDPITYDVVLTNTGDVVMTDIVVTDSREGTFDEPWPAELAPGESATRTFTSTITAEDASAGNIDNTVSVTANGVYGGEVEQRTNEYTAECPFAPVVDVTVAKSGNGPINAGEDATFTIVVSNIGDGSATDVTVTDALPAGFDWTIDPAVAGCAITGGVLECALAELAAGASVEIVVSAPTPLTTCEVLANTVTVAAGNETAGFTDNNEASATIEVQCGTVEITKYLCVTWKDRDTAFLVVAPDGTTTGKDFYSSRKCAPAAGVEFIIEGAALTEAISVTTDADGKILAILPPGEYTLTEEASGASVGFTIVASETTTIDVFNFEERVQPTPSPIPTPAPTPTPQPPTVLPDTGTGSDASGGVGTMALWLLVVSMLAGGAAIVARRRLS